MPTEQYTFESLAIVVAINTKRLIDWLNEVLTYFARYSRFILILPDA
jgi:hypothetical protein